MPRTVIDLHTQIEYLSILDENGQVDPTLDPQLPSEHLQKLYRAMLLGRRLDERMFKLQRQGRIGTFPPIKGQEAANIGAISALRDTDWMVPAFRETAAEIWRGRSIESVLLYYAGYEEGAYLPEPIRNLPISVPVGSQMLHAVGLGWSIRYRQQNDVVMTFFGDGATSEGDFHEAMNFAAVFQTPVVFVCQNNHWAISVPRAKQTRSKTIAQKALAYEMPGIQVDGNDILAMVVAAREAVERARKGNGPTLIEAVTYRMGVHTTADDPTRYRSDDEVATWAKRDPLTRFESYLKTRGVLDDAQLARLEAEIEAEIQAAVARAEARMQEPVNPLEMFDFNYATPSPYLLEQRAALAQELGLG